MPYTPILATLGYVLSPDRRRVLMIHRNVRAGDHHLGKYNGLGGKPWEADRLSARAWALKPRGNGCRRPASA